MHGSFQQYPDQTLSDLKNQSFQSFLDMARWVAATIVFIGHLRNPLFFSFGNLEADERGIFVIIWYFVTGWFGEAVILFFVLSGYLVGGIGAAKLNSGNFYLYQYSIDRISRLFVAFLPALFLTVILDYFGRAYFADAGLYSHTQAMIVEKINTASFESLATWPIFIGNFFMLQTFIVAPYGSNQPLWTISVEFWFYVVFGILALFKLYRNWIIRLVGGGLLIAIFMILGGSLLYYIGMWMIGVFIACVSAKRFEKPILALILFIGVLLISRLFGSAISQFEVGQELRSYVVAISFGYLLFSMRSIKYWVLDRIAPFNKFMADFSFSLYLIHFPIMIFILSVFYSTGVFDGIFTGYSPVDPEGLFIYFTITLIVYCVSFIFSVLTEKQTWRIRGFFVRSKPKV